MQGVKVPLDLGGGKIFKKIITNFEAGVHMKI